MLFRNEISLPEICWPDSEIQVRKEWTELREKEGWEYTEWVKNLKVDPRDWNVFVYCEIKFLYWLQKISSNKYQLLIFFFLFRILHFFIFNIRVHKTEKERESALGEIGEEKKNGSTVLLHFHSQEEHRFARCWISCFRAISHE